MMAALAPLQHLQAEAMEDHEDALKCYKADLNRFHESETLRKAANRTALKKGETLTDDPLTNRKSQSLLSTTLATRAMRNSVKC